MEAFEASKKLRRTLERLLRQTEVQAFTLADFLGHEAPFALRAMKLLAGVGEALEQAQEAENLWSSQWKATADEGFAQTMRAAFAIALAPPEMVRPLAKFQLGVVDPAKLAELEAGEK